MGNRSLLGGRRSGVLGFGLVCLLLCGSSGRGFAYDTAPHRVARLSYLQGSVTVDHLDNTGGDVAQVNMALTQGSRLATGEDGQAEVEFEDGSLVRLTPNSAIGLSALSVDGNGNYQTQIVLVHGLVYAELRATSKFSYSVDAGGVVVSPVVNSTVRIDLDAPPAVIAVLDGTVHVEHGGSGDGYRADVRAGETLSSDPAGGGRYFLTPQVQGDSWDELNESRDQAAADEVASRTSARDSYAGDQGYGWSELDANGAWYSVPGEGMVWQPNVAVDANFDPYGYGSWVWYSGTGYVWASGYGWGWTPYRCGNWSFWSGFGWGWIPTSGCGWGGWGGVYVINVIGPPQYYHFPTVPVHGPLHVHPIRVGYPAQDPNLPVTAVRGPRTIAGQTVEPLRPVSEAYTLRGGSAVGSALRLDFPVERTTHEPLLGTVSSGSAAAVVTPTGLRPSRPVNSRVGDGGALLPGQLARPPAPVVRSSSQGQGTMEYGPYQPGPRPAWSPPPGPRSGPPPAPRSAPSAASSPKK